MDPYSTQMLMMNQFNHITSVFVEHVGDLLVASVVIVVGLFVAEITKHLGGAILGLIRWNVFCNWLGITRIWNKFRADVVPAKATGEVLWWLVFVSFVMKALIITELASVAWIGRTYFEFLPLCFRGVFVLAAAYALAQGAARLIAFVVEKPGAVFAAGLVRILILSCGVYSTLLTLGWDQKFVLPAVLVLLGSAALTLALQWSLGKDRVGRQIIRVNDFEEGLS
ncbi:hypothetical protein K8S19_06530 [bacterium]|nr:hypothetical protein [bacterium]